MRMIWMVIAVFSLALGSAEAHFPWLTVDGEGRALLYFGETPAQRDYHLPEAVAKATVNQVTTAGEVFEVKLESRETDDFVGRTSGGQIAANRPLVTQFTFGNYHGTLLKYYARYQPLADKVAGWDATAMSLDAQLVRTEDGIDVHVVLDGKALKGASITLIDGAGEQATDATGDDGSASFSSLAAGDVGFIVGHTIKTAGEIDGKKYESESHYLTLTTSYTKDDAAAKPQAASAEVPPLPMPISSFGAAVCDGYAYVYGGHTGNAHDHSRDNLSPYFCRYKIGSDDDWQVLPLTQKLQGLALVAHDGKVYRVGGLEARNALHDEADLHSVATFAQYDPGSEKWTEFAPLPAPRSSHNAVVIGDTLYVVGGWQLTGDDEGTWQPTALMYDFSNAAAGWQELPEPPFRRRALAVASHAGKLVVLGGMDDNGEVSQQTFVFDPSAQTWTSGPAVPGQSFFSFGLSACEDAGKLYVLGMEGKLYVLDEKANEWQSVAKVATPRFFHQLLPTGDGQLLVIAGATHDVGHVGTTEVVSAE